MCTSSRSLAEAQELILTAGTSFRLGFESEAEAGDTGASRLMLRGAAYLAQACEALGRGAEEPLCLTGVLGTGFARWLEPDLRRVLVPPRGDVLAGAEVGGGDARPQNVCLRACARG